MIEAVEDGRIARGLRTRDAVVDALFDLYSEGNLTPTMRELADRVGMTTRSIYHHYADRDAMARAMGQRQLERHPELFAARPITGSRTERIEGIAAHRSEFFEAVAPVRRAALAVIHTSPELQTQQTNLAASLRRQLKRTFEHELSALDSSAAAEVLELLDLHTSWETWERLRRWQRLSIERSLRLVIGLVTQALER